MQPYMLSQFLYLETHQKTLENLPEDFGPFLNPKWGFSIPPFSDTNLHANSACKES